MAARLTQLDILIDDEQLLVRGIQVFPSSNNIQNDKKDKIVPVQSWEYISIISSPVLKFCPTLFGDLKSKSYFFPNKNEER